MSIPTKFQTSKENEDKVMQDTTKQQSQQQHDKMIARGSLLYRELITQVQPQTFRKNEDEVM